MAIGDDASAAGMDTVAGVDDLRDSYVEHNRTRDYLAAHQTSGTHSASQITSGTFSAARIPDLPGSKITSAVASATAAGTAGVAALANGPTSDVYSRNGSGTGPYYTVWMNSDQQFMRNTSSRRYKQNIRDWVGSVRNLRTVIFDRRGKKTPNNEVGFIAEEVLESLPDAVEYFDGEVDGIVDRAIMAALVVDVQRLYDLVEDLQKKASNSNG